MNRWDEIEQAAARWVSRKDSPDWNDQDQAALDTWLVQATEHRVAWLRLQSVWRRADRLAALAPSLNHDRRRSFVSRRGWLAIAASVTAATVSLAAWHLSSRQHSTYTTGIGGHQTVPLSDGSRLELNTRTRLRTEVDTKRRVVWLDEGEAYFDIKHDPARPFVVHVGDRRVTVLGTRFAVRRNKDHIEVAVVEGRVRVDDTSIIKAEPAAVVAGGDILVGKPSGALVASHASERMTRELSWRQGILIFDQSTLADAAAEFNRYNHKQLILADDRTASVRIGGTFDANAVDAFVRLLEQAFGLRTEERDGEIRISQR